jgi:hypothetical protein
MRLKSAQQVISLENGYLIPVAAAMSLAKDGTDFYQNWTLASTFLVIIVVAVATSL